MEDRLPRYYKRVLVCCKYEDGHFPRIATRVPKETRGEYMWFEDDGFDLQYVTHWMYIRLPKEKKL